MQPAEQLTIGEQSTHFGARLGHIGCEFKIPRPKGRAGTAGASETNDRRLVSSLDQRRR